MAQIPEKSAIQILPVQSTLDIKCFNDGGVLCILTSEWVLRSLVKEGDPYNLFFSLFM